MRSSLTSRADALWRRTWVLLVLIVGAGPFAVLLARGAPRLSGELAAHLGRTVLPMQLGYSAVAAVGAALGGAALAAGGLGCAIFDFPGRRLLQHLLLVPLLVPGWFFAMLYHEALRLDGIGGLVFVLGVSAAPLFHLFGVAALRNLPRQYAEVLRVLGHDRPASLVRVLYPLSAPALGAAGALVCLLDLADGSSPRTMAVPTLTVGLLDQWFAREDASVAVLLALVIAVVSLLCGWLLWWLLGKVAWQDSGRLGPQADLPRTRLRGMSASFPWILAAPQLTAGVLIPGCLIGKWAAERIERVNLTSLGGDIVRTLVVACGAAVGAVLLALPIVHAQATMRPSRLATLAGRTTFAVFALPSSVLALSFLWMLPNKAEPGLSAFVNATAFPLVLAFGVRFSAVCVAGAQTALVRQARDHTALMRVLGHTGIGSFLHLTRPFLARPMSAVMAFVLLASIQEQSLPLVLRPFGFETIATRVLQYELTQRIRDCSVWILCLALIGIYPLFTLARLGESKRDSTIA